MSSIQGAKKVLVQGKRLCQIIKEVYGVEPMRVRYGIDFSDFKITDPTSVFSRYGIRSPLILMVTRLLPSKRPDVMIKILPKILQDHPTATLVVACPQGRYQTIWRRFAAKIGVASSTRIISTSTSELNALYSGASVVGYPSQAEENASRGILEAMRFGVPVVAWNNEWGAAEMVKEGTGMLARPYDIDDFADKVLELLNDDEMRRRIGQRAQQHAQTFSWEHVGPSFEKILQTAVNN
jgi:glycosyltransferase involved in cell wall biosynthesis